MRVKKYLALTFAAILATTMLTGCPWEEEEDKTDDASSVPVTSTDTSQDDDDHDSGDDDGQPTKPTLTVSATNGNITDQSLVPDGDTGTYKATFTTNPTKDNYVVSSVEATVTTASETLSASWPDDTAIRARTMAVRTDTKLSLTTSDNGKTFTLAGIPADAISCNINVTFADLGYVIEGGTYKVHNADGLLAWNAAVQGNMSLNCTLIDNIDLAGEWTPIGSYPRNGYAGTFDGGGHTISNVNINTPNNDYIGLFGYVDGGTVKNLNLEITRVSGNDFVGGVVGYNDGGIIQGCMVSGGSVTASDSAAGAYVGGVAGDNYGTVKGCCFVGDSVSSTGDRASVGGVVGYNSGGTVEGCCFAGDSVTGGSSTTVGGVVGDNGIGSITDCYWKKGPEQGVGQNDGAGTPDVTQINDDVPMQTAIAAMNNYLTGYQYELKGDQIVLVASSNTPEVSGLTQKVLDAARMIGL